MTHDSISPTLRHDSAEVAGETAGRQLQYAREQRGLDLARVAAELRLTPATVLALETDDYTRLPSPVFVRGYLNSYARLLGIDPEPVLAAYQGARTAAASTAPDAVVAARPTGDKRWGTRATALLTLLMLGGGIFFWWWTNERAGLPDIMSWLGTRTAPRAAAESPVAPAEEDSPSPATDAGQTRHSPAEGADAPEPATENAPRQEPIPAAPPVQADSNALAATGSSPVATSAPSVATDEDAPEPAAPVAREVGERRQVPARAARNSA